MTPSGRPKGEYRRAQPEGGPVSAGETVARPAMSRLFSARRPGMLPVVVLLAGLALSIALALLARRELATNANDRFDAVAMDIARKVERRFDDYTAVLVGLQARFNTEQELTRKDFRDYVAGLNLPANYPGFQAVNFAAYLRADDKARFETVMREDAGLAAAIGSPYAVKPPGARAEYYPLAFIEPLAGNERLLGNDLGAMPNRGNALEQSRDTGGLASSGRRIRIGQKQAIGLAMRLPVYRPGTPLETVEQRRAAYIGSVGAGFSVAAMLRDVIGAHDAQTTRRLRLLDAGPGPGATGTRSESRFVSVATVDEEQLLYDSAAPEGGPAAAAAATHPPVAKAADRVQRRLAFELGGHSWLIEVSDDEHAVTGAVDEAAPWLIAVAGAIISALLAGVVYSLGTAGSRAQALARDMTRHLRDSERQLEDAQRLANLGSWILDGQTGRLQCSAEATRILGLDGSGVTELAALLSRVPADERNEVGEHIREAARCRERREFDHHLLRGDGGERWLHVIVEPTEEAGRPLLRGVVRDDTQQRRSALRLNLEHEIARLLLADGEPNTVLAKALEAACVHLRWDCAALWRAGVDGRARCTAAWRVADVPALEHFVRISRTLEYRADEGSLGRAWAQGRPVRVDRLQELNDFTRDAFAGRAGLSVGLIVPTTAAGSMTALEFHCRDPQAADADALESLNVIAMQIAQYEQRMSAEQQLRHVASHDALTGLQNRASLERELSRAIKRSNRHRMRFAVMFIDLDRFKHINDTLGHGVGDMMIRVCGERLQSMLREDDTVARFGGDEFVLLLENLSSPSDAAVLAKKALACFEEPFLTDGHELHISASIGVSVYPEDGNDAEALVKNADTAMYRAKERGRGTYCFYTAQMNAQGTERLMLESGLRRAVDRGELELHYQPKLELGSQRIVGVEALMRWRHPALGMVSPAQFIPIAEETGLIEPIGRWALERACADVVAWRALGLPALQMSVNVSPRQLGSRSIINEIRGILDSTGLEPGLLELEITEGAMMKNPEHAVKLLEDIRALGVGLAIDDFGTGYSSLSYLRRFPLSTVKIDRAFINDVSENADAQALVDSIITLAHGLRMKVVAEGVETMVQLDHLRSRGCDEIQGFLLCKPLPRDELCKFVLRHISAPFASPIAA
jgi:diguanylate cyclase (GGDEF)-like protein/PAS domain S-box-containing protein